MVAFVAHRLPVPFLRSAVAIGILTGVLVASQGCQSSPPPVFSDIRGTHLSEGADIQGDDQTVQAILSLFKKAEVLCNARISMA